MLPGDSAGRVVRSSIDPIRRLAVEVLLEVEKGSFLDTALDRARGRLTEQGPAVGRLHFLTTGTVKWQGRLDYELNSRLPKGVDSLPRPCRAVLRLALFEMRMSNVPDYAVVDTAVDLVRALGLGGLGSLVNALLREAGRQREPDPPTDEFERLSVTTSHPRWLLETVVESYGLEAAEALADWDNAPPPLWVRVDLSRVTVERARELLEAQGVSAGPAGPLPGYLLLGQGAVPATISGISEGWLTVQDPSAGLASLMAVPLEGRRVADICAAPGGKSTHLAELCRGGAIVEATDSDPERYRLLCDNVRRHGGKGLRVRLFEEVMSGVRSYDVVLVDAPCSNLGVLRRRADARWRIGSRDLSRLATLQLELIEKGAELVRPGGVLVYSTCTIAAEENEMVVERFLSNHDEFDRDNVPPQLPQAFIKDRATVGSLPWRDSIDGAFAVRLIRRDHNV